jgi:hypothetical protein
MARAQLIAATTPELDERTVAHELTTRPPWAATQSKMRARLVLSCSSVPPSASIEPL